MDIASLLSSYGPFLVAIAATGEILAFLPGAARWVRERWLKPDRLAHLNRMIRAPDPPAFLQRHQRLAFVLVYGLLYLTPILTVLLPVALIVSTGEAIGVISRSYFWVPLAIQPLMAFHIACFVSLRKFLFHLLRIVEAEKAEKRFM